MSNQEFETPQEALAHYGVKGMKWGIRRKDKSGGDVSSKSSEKVKKEPLDALKKGTEDFYKTQDPAKLQAEGQKKLEAQANQSFPTKEAAKQIKREAKAEKIEEAASKFDEAARKAETARDAIDPGYNPLKRYERSLLKNEVKLNDQFRDDLLKKADQVRAGKLTDDQKKLIAAGAVVAVAGLALYGNRQYNLRQAGVTRDVKKSLIEENRRKSNDEWNTLFGEDAGFTSTSYISSKSTNFYGGLTSGKAFDRPEFKIPSGTVFQRLSNHPEDSSEYGVAKGAYATFLSNDKKRYGSSIEFGSKKYTVNFTAKGDVRVPDHQTVLSHLKRIKDQDFPNSPEITPKKLGEIYHVMAGGSWSDPTSRKLFDSLKKSGYSAIVDDMDAGALGDLPVVFFGEANVATSTSRTSVDKSRDSVGRLKLTGKYA